MANATNARNVLPANPLLLRQYQFNRQANALSTLGSIPFTFPKQFVPICILQFFRKMGARATHAHHAKNLGPLDDQQRLCPAFALNSELSLLPEALISLLYSLLYPYLNLIRHPGDSSFTKMYRDWKQPQRHPFVDGRSAQAGGLDHFFQTDKAGHIYLHGD